MSSVQNNFVNNFQLHLGVLSRNLTVWHALY